MPSHLMGSAIHVTAIVALSAYVAISRKDWLFGVLGLAVAFGFAMRAASREQLWGVAEGAGTAVTLVAVGLLAVIALARRHRSHGSAAKAKGARG